MKYKIVQTGVEITEEDGFYRVNVPNSLLFPFENLKELGLTIEPVKPVERKLYAYIDTNGWVSHRTEESLPKSSYAISTYTRSKQYDIVYPNEEVK